MNKHIKFKIIFLLILLLGLSACATASQGTKQKITVKSIPRNAEVMTSHGYGCDATPCSFYVPRNKGFELKVAKPGFSTKKVKIKPIIGGAGALKGVGSVVLGGVIAGGYDVYKGADFELSPDHVSVKLENMSALLFEEVRLVSNMNLFGSK